MAVHFPKLRETWTKIKSSKSFDPLKALYEYDIRSIARSPEQNKELKMKQNLPSMLNNPLRFLEPLLASLIGIEEVPSIKNRGIYQSALVGLIFIPIVMGMLIVETIWNLVIHPKEAKSTLNNFVEVFFWQSLKSLVHDICQLVQAILIPVTQLLSALMWIGYKVKDLLVGNHSRSNYTQLSKQEEPVDPQNFSSGSVAKGVIRRKLPQPPTHSKPDLLKSSQDPTEAATGAERGKGGFSDTSTPITTL